MSDYEIRAADDGDGAAWDEYVLQHPLASQCHLFGWRNVLRAAYGKSVDYLMLRQAGGRVAGILPLVRFRHPLFGNELASMPFMDGGGVLADSTDAERRLVARADALARESGADGLELRCEHPLACFEQPQWLQELGQGRAPVLSRKSTKVRMVVELPASSELLMKGFKSKLRSQISKPIKAGCTVRTGGLDLLEDFYRVFLVNMRDLGSPVHSIGMIRETIAQFSERTAVLVVYHEGAPVAGAVVTGFRDLLKNPWASSDRRYAAQSPNMLLYLRMLEWACDNGYRRFDFGRSTVGEGTYRFKEQWGALPEPLHWYRIARDGVPENADASESRLFSLAAQYWKKLPLKVTACLGPRIRKHISL